MKDHIINHYIPSRGYSERNDNWDPFLNTTKLISYDSSGKFCAFVKSNQNIIALWNMDSIILPMVSFDCSKYVDKDMYCKSIVWSPDSKYLTIIYLKYNSVSTSTSSSSKIINNSTSSSIVLTWNILEQSFIYKQR